MTLTENANRNNCYTHPTLQSINNTCDIIYVFLGFASSRLTQLSQQRRNSHGGHWATRPQKNRITEGCRCWDLCSARLRILEAFVSFCFESGVLDDDDDVAWRQLHQRSPSPRWRKWIKTTFGRTNHAAVQPASTNASGLNDTGPRGMSISQTRHPPFMKGTSVLPKVVRLRGPQG